jgi:type IV pilus assembly protein PilQ
MKRILISLAVLSALGLGVAGSLPDTPQYNQLVTVQTGPSGTPLAAVLNSLAQSVGLSPILEGVPNVIVNLSLTQKPFRQVWDLLIATYGGGNLDYELLPNNVILVAPPSVIARALPAPKSSAPPPSAPLEQRFYTLQTLSPTEAAQFLQREVPGVSVQAVPGEPVIAVSGTEQEQVTVAQLLAQIDLPKTPTPPVVQKVFTLKYANAVQLAQVLEQLLKTSTKSNEIPPPSIVADPGNNSLIARGTEAQLESLSSTIAELDTPAQQVELHVRIQEVNDSVFHSLGINWNTIAGGNFVASILQSGLSLIFNPTQSLASLNINATLNALSQQNLSKTLSDANLIVQNDYGASTGSLSSPGATAAEVKAGGQVIITLPSSGNAPPTTQTYDYGLIVRLRPHITPNGRIILEVFVQTGGQPESGPNNSILIPQNTVLTQFRLKNGQTVVLGGTVVNQNQSNTYKVPLLGDIPILGFLFRQTNQTVSNSEVLVVITAKILGQTASR